MWGSGGREDCSPRKLKFIDSARAYILVQKNSSTFSPHDVLPLELPIGPKLGSSFQHGKYLSYECMHEANARRNQGFSQTSFLFDHSPKALYSHHLPSIARMFNPDVLSTSTLAYLRSGPSFTVSCLEVTNVLSSPYLRAPVPQASTNFPSSFLEAVPNTNV